MPDTVRPKINRRSYQILLVLLICLQCVLIYLFAFEDWQGPGDFGGNYNYVPAVMIAAGKGFTDVEMASVEDIPALDRFISFETMHLDPALLPEDMPIIEANDLHRIYQYLLYTVGYLWKVFGISWNVVRVLCVFVLFCCAMLVYGISRLMLPSSWSLLVAHAFVWNTAVLSTMHSFRDFSKAVFILSAVYILGTMIKTRSNRWHYIGSAILIGAILGVGMGFRRDMQLIFPLSLLVLAICRLQYFRYRVFWRSTALILSIFVFVAVSSPVLMNLYHFRWLNAHDTIMGFATRSDEALGLLEPASYEKHMVQSDVYTTYQVFSAFRYGIFDGAGEDVTRPFSNEAYHRFLYRYIFYSVGMFPADFLSRAYAAVLRSCVGVREAWFLPFRFFEVFGFIFVGIGLMSIAAFYPYKAWQILLMLCLFCGYTSIQYGVRHAFYTTFIPYLFGCFVLYHFIRIYASRKDSVQYLSARQVRRRVLCLSLWTLVTGLAFWIPLKAAQHIQEAQVEHLQEAYTNAERLPVAQTRISGRENGTVIRPASAKPCEKCVAPGTHNSVAVTVYVAHFDASVESLDVTLVYDYYDSGDDLGGTATCHTESGVSPGKISFYFPVYEIVHGSNWNMFSGLLMSEEQASHFLGFEKLNNISNLNFFLNLTMPENQNAFLPAQRIKLPWPHIPRRHPAYRNDCVHYGKTTDGILKLLEEGRPQAAISSCHEMLERRPESLHVILLLAHAHFLGGEAEKSWEIIDAVLCDYGEHAQVYRRLDMMFADINGTEARHHKWQVLLQKYPESPCTRFYYEASLLALIEVALNAGDISCYQRLIIDNAEFEQAVIAVDAWLKKNASPSDRAAFWHEVVENNPSAVLPYLQLGIALEHEEKYEAAAEAYAKGYGNGPENVDAVIRYATCKDTGLDNLAVLNIIEKTCSAYPDMKILAMERLRRFRGETADTMIQLINRKEGIPDAVRAALLVNLAALEAEPNEVSFMAYIEQHAPQLKNSTGKAMLEETYAQRSLGNMASAEKMAFMATALIPSNQEAWMLSGAILESQEKVADAEKAYRQGILNAASIDSVAERFNGLLSRTARIEKQVQEWKTLAEMRTDKPIIFLYYLNALTASNNWQEAYNTARHALELFPDNAFLALSYGHVLMYRGEHDEGLALIEKAVLQERGLLDRAVDILINLVDGREDNQLVREKVFGVLVRLRPETPYFWVQWAIALKALDKTDDAVAALTKAIGMEPFSEAKTAATYLDLWLDPARRKVVWQEVVAKLPAWGKDRQEVSPDTNIFIMTRYAKALADTGQLQNAENVLFELQERYPENEEVDLALGIVQCQKGDSKTGVPSIATILDNHPERRPEVVAEMERIYNKALGEKRYIDSEEMARSLAMLESENPLRYFQIGEALYRQQRYQHALKQFEQVLTVAPESPRTANRVESIFEKLSQPDACIAFWKRLLEIHPKSSLLKVRLENAMNNKGEM